MEVKRKCNTPQLLEEIINRSGSEMTIMHQPLKILYSILQEVAKRASNLDDRELNKLMMRLSLYDIADPRSNVFDQDIVEAYIKSDS